MDTKVFVSGFPQDPESRGPSVNPFPCFLRFELLQIEQELGRADKLEQIEKVFYPQTALFFFVFAPQCLSFNAAFLLFGRYALLFAFNKTFGREFWLLVGGIRFSQLFFYFLGPITLRYLLIYIQDSAAAAITNSDGQGSNSFSFWTSIYSGLLLVLAIFVNVVFQTEIMQYYYFAGEQCLLLLSSSPARKRRCALNIILILPLPDSPSLSRCSEGTLGCIGDDLCKINEIKLEGQKAVHRRRNGKFHVD